MPILGQGRMKEYFRFFFSKLVTAKRKGISFILLKPLLIPVSWGFQAVVTCRNWAYERNYLGRYHSPVPLVISIGNIVAGGTGKTPVTLMVAQEFIDDVLIAILSRGYRSPAETKAVPTFLSEGEGILCSAHECGDEPFLLASRLPKSLVIVGRDRTAGAQMAFQAGAQLILLDDGMQHRRLARDLEILVVHAKDPFGQGYFLPRGLLREGPKSLSRANLIILNHTLNQEHFEALEKRLRPYTSAPVVGTQMEVDTFRNLSGKVVPSIKNKQVGIFCGIAHPEQFKETVKKQGAEIVASKFFSDHYPFDRDELASFAKLCKEKGAEMLVCTEKDYVKLVDPGKLAIPLVHVRMRLRIVAGAPHWHTFIAKAKSILKIHQV